MGVDDFGRNVHIKAVASSSVELKAIKYLSLGKPREDPQNHTIPLLKIIPAGKWSLVVQAWWGSGWHLQRSHLISDRLGLAQQLVEVSD